MCAVKLFLGLPCPGCGLLHALWSLIHLDWQSAFHFYPIWPIFILLVLFRRRPAMGHFFVVTMMIQWVGRLVIFN